MSNLPIIVPRDAWTLWHTPTIHLPRSLPSPVLESTQPAHVLSRRAQQQNQSQQRDNRQTPSALQILQADEDHLASRKSNVRRFGSRWLRPPGVAKTYQATIDEAVERQEQEALARREQAAIESQAAVEESQRQAQEQAVRARVMVGDGADTEMNVDVEDEGEGMGRDLDAGVPEAEGEGFEEDDEDDDQSVISDAEEVEHDLDEDIVEAGSYQHTDTDVEDDSEEEPSYGNSPGLLRSARQPAEPFVLPGEANARLSDSAMSGSNSSGGRGVAARRGNGERSFQEHWSPRQWGGEN